MQKAGIHVRAEARTLQIPKAHTFKAQIFVGAEAPYSKKLTCMHGLKPVPFKRRFLRGLSPHIPFEVALAGVETPASLRKRLSAAEPPSLNKMTRMHGLKPGPFERQGPGPFERQEPVPFPSTPTVQL